MKNPSSKSPSSRRRSSVLPLLTAAVLVGLALSAALVRILRPRQKEPDFYSVTVRKIPK